MRARSGTTSGGGAGSLGFVMMPPTSLLSGFSQMKKKKKKFDLNIHVWKEHSTPCECVCVLYNDSSSGSEMPLSFLLLLQCPVGILLLLLLFIRLLLPPGHFLSAFLGGRERERKRNFSEEEGRQIQKGGGKEIAAFAEKREEQSPPHCILFSLEDMKTFLRRF